MGWGLLPTPRGARWCFLSPSCSSCQAELGKARLDRESSPQPLAVPSASQTSPCGARNLFLARFSVPLIKCSHLWGGVVAVMDLSVVSAGQKIKGMLSLFLRRQNVIAQVSSCLGFTPHLYRKCPRSSLALLLCGGKGLRLVHAGEGFTGTPVPDLEPCGDKGCSSPSAAG